MGWPFKHKGIGAILIVLISLPAMAQFPSSDTLSLIFVGGQSNALNLHADANLLPHSNLDSTIKFYFHSGLAPDQTSWPTAFIATSDSNWITLRTQSQDPFVALFEDFFGPEMSMARTLVQGGVPNLGVFKVAYAGTHLAHDWKKGDHSMADAYDHFLRQLDIATDSLMAWNIPWKFIGMAWMQGESDASDYQWALDYQNNLSTFLADVRADIMAPDLPVVLGQIADGNSYPYTNEVRLAQQAVANADPLVTLVNLDDLEMETDNVHFLGQGIMSMGERFAESIISTYNPLNIKTENLSPLTPYVLQAYPNPFNGSVALSIVLNESTHMKLQILDASGRQIKMLVSGNRISGLHTFHWDGRDDAGQIQSSGVYLMVLKTPQWCGTTKLLHLK